MLNYPILKRNGTIGITAPSSGVKKELHPILKEAIERMEARGFAVQCGETPWMHSKLKSAPAYQRAEELNRMLTDPNIDLIIPPWGGELLLEIIDLIDYSAVQPKWILGYSDTSMLLLAITLNTGIATAHGTNLIDLRGERADNTTGKWLEVLGTKVNQTVQQFSSERYQKDWNFEEPTEMIFDLTHKTQWKLVSGTKKTLNGRLLGGCVDVIRSLIGTPYGDVKKFQKEQLLDEPILWYLENCELTLPDLRRSLLQMKLAGWFDSISGILFGRSDANLPQDGYTVEELYQDLEKELGVPIVYDVDCGHVPPQITWINGARATVEIKDGKATVCQLFKT